MNRTSDVRSAPDPMAPAIGAEGVDRTVRRRTPLLLVPGITAGAVAATLAFVTLSSGGDPHGAPTGRATGTEEGHRRPAFPGFPSGAAANAAVLLNRAAITVESKPFSPRPDQWIYIEDHQRFPAIGTLMQTPKTPLVTFVERTWWRADGNKVAREQEGYYGEGKLRMENGPAGWKHHYPTLASLPTDPNALDNYILKQLVGGLAPSNAEERATALYEAYCDVLRNGVAPPKLQAAIYRAIARIPGVALRKHTVDPAGRQAMGVGRVIESYLLQEILIDPTSYTYLAERETAVKDHTSTDSSGLTQTVKKGAVLNLETHTIPKIVDQPGRHMP